MNCANWLRAKCKSAGAYGEKHEMKNGRLLTTGEISKYCNVSRPTVLVWIKSGKLVAYCLPSGHHRISRQTFWDFLAKHNMPIDEEFFSV